MNKILIFGGTGSLGKFLIKRLLKKNNIGSIVTFSRCEEKSVLIRQMYPDVNAYIGDIRDYKAVERCIAVEKPDIIINAVALKNVPECEDHPHEALKTNSFGAQNIVEAIERSPKSIIALAISTDKAAKPVNFYGMTKALQERLWIRGNGNSVFNLVRYGNVLGSRGSVIPFFKDKIENNQDLPVTHELMDRFLLSLDESVDLIFRALEDNEGKKIFIPKVKSATMMDLASIMIEHSGKDLKINIVGVRPGEKLSEILVSEEEMYRTEDVGDVLVIHDILKKYHNYNCEFLNGCIEYSSHMNSILMNKEQLKIFLKEREQL